MMATIRVGNFNASVTTHKLRDEFTKFGVIRRVMVASGSPYYAFIEFVDRRNAQDAIWRYCKNGWTVELAHNSIDGGDDGRIRDCRSCSPPRYQRQEVKYAISPDHYRNMFEERRKIGKGASGEVFECVNKVDGLTYAIKKIKKIEFSSEDCEKFVREVSLIARLHHPNVVRYYQCWIEKGVEDNISSGTLSVDSDTPTITPTDVATSTPEEVFEDLESDDIPDTIILPGGYTLYLAMEYCPETLESKIESGLSLETGLDYARQIVEGLRHIHSKNVINMDIWPKNILIDSSGNVKIADFGSAVGFEAGESIQACQLDLGHCYYRAPEMRDGAIITTKVDIFSTGMVIFSMLHPMKGKSERKRTFRSLEKATYHENGTEVLSYLMEFIIEDPSLRSTAESII